MSDITKYLTLAEQQCRANTKCGRRAADVLYRLLTEEWGEFVKAINQWLDGRGIAGVELNAVGVLAVLYEAAPEAIGRVDQQPPPEGSWLAGVRAGNILLGEGKIGPLAIIIQQMLRRALDEEDLKNGTKPACYSEDDLRADVQAVLLRFHSAAIELPGTADDFLLKEVVRRSRGRAAPALATKIIEAQRAQLRLAHQVAEAKSK